MKMRIVFLCLINFSFIFSCTSEQGKCESKIIASNRFILESLLCPLIIADITISNRTNSTGNQTNESQKNILFCIDNSIAIKNCKKKSDAKPYWLK
jgi:hypothetical protein